MSEKRTPNQPFTITSEQLLAACVASGVYPVRVPGSAEILLDPLHALLLLRPARWRQRYAAIKRWGPTDGLYWARPKGIVPVSGTTVSN